MPDPLLPAQCIEEAIWNNLPLLEDTMTKQERLQLLFERGAPVSRR